jgi:hypothetical protein
VLACWPGAARVDQVLHVLVVVTVVNSNDDNDDEMALVIVG